MECQASCFWTRRHFRLIFCPPLPHFSTLPYRDMLLSNRAQMSRVELERVVAAALGDLIRITDRRTFLAQEVLNVYFYRVTSITGLGTGYLDLMGAAFADLVVDPVAALQASDVSHSELFLENLSNGIDINTFTTGFPVVGAAGSDSLPPYASYGFQLIREDRTTRNGYKRFAGVTEANQTDGIYTGGATAISNVEDALKADMVVGLV